MSTRASRIRIAAAAVGLAVVSTLVQSVDASAAETTTSLMKRISAAGLGCDKVLKVQSVAGGKRIICTVGTERIKIDVYPAKIFKKALALACSSGTRFIAVTDGRSWMIVPQSRTTADLLGKTLSTSVKVLCSSGAIVNEGSPKTPPPPKKGSFDNPYLLGETFEVGTYKLGLKATTPDATKAVCDSFQGEMIVPELCRAEFDSSLNVVVSVDPAKTADRYVEVTLQVTNGATEISYPHSDLLVQITTPTGALDYPVSYLISSDLLNWRMSLIPNGSAAGNLFFKVAQTTDLAVLRVVVRSLEFGVDTVAYLRLI